MLRKTAIAATATVLLGLSGAAANAAMLGTPVVTKTAPVAATAAGAVAGGAVSGQVNLLPEPFRAYDSRAGEAGRLPGGKRFGVNVFTDQAQNAKVPADAKGVLVNITSTDATSSGWLGATSIELTGTSSSLLNYEAANKVLSVANTGFVKTGTHNGQPGYIAVHAGGGATHVIIDVIGYVH